MSTMHRTRAGRTPFVIPTQAETVPVIPAEAGIQGALGPRLRGDDGMREQRA